MANMKTISLLILLLFAGTLSASAQTSDPIASQPQVRRALEYIKTIEPETIAEQIKTCEIPAPPFKEEKRAAFYHQRFTELGLKNVRIDKEGNVIGERPGTSNATTLVLAAHLDTVFPEGTDVKVTRAGKVLKGPGIGDDCRGLAVLLTVARALNEAQIQTQGHLVFVADVGEEGLGNLRGVRHLVTEEMKGRLTHFISVDGLGHSTVNHEIGSNRYRVTFRGPGGHSYGAFGLPSAIHGLGRAIEKIARLPAPKAPKTTFTVGKIEGGTSVNSIAHTAWMEVDMRSESAEELAKIDAAFKRAVQAARAEENAFWNKPEKLTVEIKLIGERPVGQQAKDAPIVKAALAADAALGLHSQLRSGSTDAGMPLRFGIPAITIGGGGQGSGAHSLDETFDTTDSHLGPQRALLIALHLVGLQ
jgi:acetylornithine deacetylase/succinyl-diaminopimelate desuccinylase-like protein